MSKYVFEPEDLQRIVKMHLDVPLDQRFDRIAETLKAVYGDHIHTGEEWIWSNAGGIMCSMSVLHTSPREYLLFCGTAVGSEGHLTYIAMKRLRGPALDQVTLPMQPREVARIGIQISQGLPEKRPSKLT